MPVTPQPGLVTEVVTGGTSVIALPANLNGGIITNPAGATGQGLGAPESLFVTPVGAANTDGNGATFELQPGQSWQAISGQTTPTQVNALSSGHKFSAVFW